MFGICNFAMNGTITLAVEISVLREITLIDIYVV